MKHLLSGQQQTWSQSFLVLLLQLNNLLGSDRILRLFISAGYD